MEQETYLERIKKLKSSRKITNDKLSEMTGIPLGTLSKLLAGINDSPKLVNMVAISRALDCSLDWLITGVPENTNNYTLEPAEMTLIEDYRGLDTYGRTMVATVMRTERERSKRQADEMTIRLHEVARGESRRAGSRLRRRGEDSAESGHTVYRVRPEMAVSATTDAAFESPRVAGVIVGGGAMPVASEGAAQSAAQSAAFESPHKVIVGGGAVAATDAIPAAPVTRSTDLPAGLRRRPIGLYDLPVSAGAGEFLADASRTDIMIPDDARTAEADYALRIKGDSMEPRYRSGDILLIQTAESVEEGELGIFILDGAGYFKKYGGDHLISLNPDYAPIPLRDFAEVSCCGRVVGKLKRK